MRIIMFEDTGKRGPRRFKRMPNHAVKGLNKRKWPWHQTHGAFMRLYRLSGRHKQGDM